jgi:hypothetical protein
MGELSMSWFRLLIVASLFVLGCSGGKTYLVRHLP